MENVSTLVKQCLHHFSEFNYYQHDLARNSSGEMSLSTLFKRIKDFRVDPRFLFLDSKNDIIPLLSIFQPSEKIFSKERISSLMNCNEKISSIPEWEKISSLGFSDEDISEFGITREEYEEFLFSGAVLGCLFLHVWEEEENQPDVEMVSLDEMAREEDGFDEKGWDDFDE